MKMRAWLLLFLGTFSTLQAGEPMPVVEHGLPSQLERESWTLDLSGAFLKKIISPLANHPYRMAPALLTLKSPGWMHWPLGSGTFCIRNTATVIAEPIFGGPETHYFGLALRPSFEWWRGDERLSFYFSPGGGVGAIDSRGVKGGQGQDFTLNILASAGVGWKVADRVSLRTGVLFQHLSNGGQTNPNPGLNAIGPELALSFSF